MSVAKHPPRRSRTEAHRSFATRLPVAILHELDQAAKETGLRKNEILSQAFIEWNKERKKAH